MIPRCPRAGWNGHDGKGHDDEDGNHPQRVGCRGFVAAAKVLVAVVRVRRVGREVEVRAGHDWRAVGENGETTR